MYELSLEGSSTPTPSPITVHQWDGNLLRISTPLISFHPAQNGGPEIHPPYDSAILLDDRVHVLLAPSSRIPHEVSVPSDRECHEAHTQQVQLPDLKFWRKVVIKCKLSPDLIQGDVFSFFLESQPSVSFSSLKYNLPD